MNHSATAHLCPLVTARTPWGFSFPAPKPIMRPQRGRTSAWGARKQAEKGHVYPRFRRTLVTAGEQRRKLTVTVFASSSAKMKSPPSKSSFR